MTRIYFDVETHPIAPSALAPRLVCSQWKEDNGSQAWVSGRQDTESLLVPMLEKTDLIWVGAGIHFDLADVCANWPDLIPAVFALYEQHRVEDVQIRDKLLMLGTHGYIDSAPTPSGGSQRIGYSLAAIADRRLGIQLAGKEDEGEDRWRVNFRELEDIPVAEWPEEPREYALSDVRVLPEIYARQDELAQRVRSTDPFATQFLHAAAAFALYLMSCWGVAIDERKRDEIQAWLAVELEKWVPQLVQHGILRPGEPARPHKNNPAKMTAEKKPSKNMEALRAIVAEVSQQQGLEIVMTDGGKDGENPQVSTAEEVIQELEAFDVRLTHYHEFQKLQKLATTELPRIQAARVHPSYDVLKETGRTSSFASKLVPSCNIQNVDPRARACYVPEEGWLIGGADYASLELVTLAQKQIDLFGKSTLGDQIRSGIDPHLFLGARLSTEIDPDRFPKSYETFALWRKEGTEEQKAYVKHWRTLAKPVGLGYPGGLGPRTMVTLAKGTYGVTLSIELATQCRDIWHATYPEMREYFDWVNRQELDEGEYHYMSPMGMLRWNCTYCACANGAALQTPAAEGAKLATFAVVRECLDPTRKSVLYGCRPWAFIHDELLVNVPDDAWAHERVTRIAQIMVQEMAHIVRDVPVRAEPKLMRRWSKEAESAYDSRGRLIPWEAKT